MTIPLLIIALLLCLSPGAAFPQTKTPAAPEALKTEEASAHSSAHFLREGKTSLDKGNFDKAATLLSSSYEKLPVLGDYALLWRSKAYEGRGDMDKALADLRTLKEKYRESPLLKKAKLREIALLKKMKDPSLARLYESFVKDNPSNMEIKYDYALYLKDNNEKQKARDLFREIYTSPCSFSTRALGELSPEDITADDLVKRGKNLNSAWLFEDAEKAFREALRKNGTASRDDILNGLAYSLFRQKRYTEAADIYKQTGEIYWRARAIFRAGDMDALQAEMPDIQKTGDKRLAAVLLAYGMKKKREGNTEEALKIFNTVLSLYPSAKEEALWAMGWTYYLSKDYPNAAKIFSQLQATYGDAKYLYWNAKCKKMLGDPEPLKVSQTRKNGHDFYTLLSLVRNEQKLPALDKHPSRISLNDRAMERTAILEELGLKREAVSELLHLARRNPSRNDLISISSYLKNLGEYRAAINIISKMPYSEELHDLFYPLGYWNEVEEAAKKRDIDPYLVLSVMREESRFAPDARSIAGAMGLMQMMPQTAHKFNKNIKAGSKHAAELYDPETNISIGTRYLKQLLSRYGSIPLALAAYNGGEDMVNEWVRNGKYASIDEFIEDIPFDETRNYVKKVMTSYFEYLRKSNPPDISAARKHLGDF
ncbi:MAG TPA: transglycosylase SLT domain-containing protein [Dissulfurispiraceae bacterium]